METETEYEEFAMRSYGTIVNEDLIVLKLGL